MQNKLSYSFLFPHKMDKEGKSQGAKKYEKSVDLLEVLLIGDE